jgi:uncharacterized membrane protein YeiB
MDNGKTKQVIPEHLSLGVWFAYAFTGLIVLSFVPEKARSVTMLVILAGGITVLPGIVKLTEKNFKEK